ncbi:MAG: PEP-CTERM sorting domain-containing protein [Gammaproteobacteria bacterium]
MRRLIQLLVLLAAPMAAYAQPDTVPVPEPETLSLLAIGALAIVLARLRRKS